MRFLTLFLIGFIPLLSYGQNIDFPKATSVENGFKGPVKTVYELEYECPNYVEYGSTKRVMAIGFLPNSKIDFKEFYYDGKVYIRLDYDYNKEKLVQRTEEYKQGNYMVVTEYAHSDIDGNWEEKTYLDNELVSRGKYKRGQLIDLETYNGNKLTHHKRYDMEDGIIHHINDDEMNKKTGELQMRWETDFTYENEKLKQKVHFVRDYIYYKNTFEYHENGELMQLLSVDNNKDTIFMEKYDERGNLIWKLDTKLIKGERIVHEFKYDKSNLVSRTSSSMFQDDTTWTYDDKNRKIKETALRDNEIMNERVWTYENDVITKCTSTGIDNYRVHYTYDGYKNCIKEMTVFEDAPVHVLYRRIYYHKK
ncbi:MAG: hypothetical protein MK078_00305 [Crocinitomicaceae bacterium]|nr:hypothetical protein [Crocinitomicaceae bacterium]